MLYFTAVSVLWFVLAASYASEGDQTGYKTTHVWVFLVNSALCTVITLGKVLQRTSPEVSLALEAVYLHGTIIAAVAVRFCFASMLYSTYMQAQAQTRVLVGARSLEGRPVVPAWYRYEFNACWENILTSAEC